MKAAVRSTYGSAEVLSIKKISKPSPNDDEVLIKVHATTVSRTDCHVLAGTPFIMRLFTGLSKPHSKVTGADFAGQIEAVGKDVQSFKPGDRVMGFGGVFASGSHAEYLRFRETKGIVMIPDTISYEVAAACIEGGYYAYNGLDKLKLQPGHKVLVNGATGAIGSATIQFLKLYNVFITAVCRSEHSELVRSLGADKVIDYTTTDFMDDDEKYDFVFDTIGNATFARVKPMLNKNGSFLPADGIWNMFLSFITPLLGWKKVLFSPPKNIKSNLIQIADLVKKGSFRPVIDRKYPFDQITEAFTYAASGQKVGNVVVLVTS